MCVFLFIKIQNVISMQSGLFKKAYELLVLCDAEVVLIVFPCRIRVCF